MKEALRQRREPTEKISMRFSDLKTQIQKRFGRKPALLAICTKPCSGFKTNIPRRQAYLSESGSNDKAATAPKTSLSRYNILEDHPISDSILPPLCVANPAILVAPCDHLPILALSFLLFLLALCYRLRCSELMLANLSPSIKPKAYLITVK